MFKKIIALITSFFIVEQVASANETTNSKLLLNTSKGEIVIKFLPDLAPVHVARIIELCLLYTSPSPRDLSTSRMPSSA